MNIFHQRGYHSLHINYQPLSDQQNTSNITPTTKYPRSNALSGQSNTIEIRNDVRFLLLSQLDPSIQPRPSYETASGVPFAPDGVQKSSGGVKMIYTTYILPGS